MKALLQCEWRKTKGCYIFLTALAITVLGLCWGLYGEYTDTVIQHGWRMFLYQFPLINAIFLPLLSMVVASRLCGMEHRGNMLKELCCITKREKLYDVKLLYGLGIMTVCTLIMWFSTIMTGVFHGFEGAFPFKLYLLYLLFTLVPTYAIYLLQHTLSLLFQNQAVPFFIGVLGEFAGLFSMFLPQFPLLSKSILWGYYGVLQFVGLFGWNKETRYANAHFDVMPIDWFSFIILILAGAAIYCIGKYLFRQKEV